MLTGEENSSLIWNSVLYRNRPIPDGVSVSFHLIRFYYLFGPTQGWSAGEEDGTLGALNERHQNLGPRRVSGFEVMRLVHDDHGKALPAQGLQQGSGV